MLLFAHPIEIFYIFASSKGNHHKISPWQHIYLHYTNITMEEKRPDERQLIESQKHYSDDGLWEKVKTVAKKAGLQVIYLALILFYTASAPTTPTSKKSVIYGALGYFILPIDLIPDAIPVVGYTDDMAALMGIVAAVATCITPAIKQQAKDKLHDWFGDYDDKEVDDLVK